MSNWPDHADLGRLPARANPPRPPAGRAERLKLADEQLRSVRQSLLAVRFLLEEYACEPDIAEARICLLAADDNACDAQRAVDRASAK